MLRTVSLPLHSLRVPASAAPGQAPAHLARSLSAMAHLHRRSLLSPSRLALKVLIFPVLPRALPSALPVLKAPAPATLLIPFHRLWGTAGQAWSTPHSCPCSKRRRRLTTVALVPPRLLTSPRPS